MAISTTEKLHYKSSCKLLVLEMSRTGCCPVFFVWAWSALFLCWPVNSVTHDLLVAGDSGCFDPFLGEKETFNIIQQSRTFVDDLLLHVVAQISC